MDWEQVLKTGVRIGLKPHEIDNLTPFELMVMTEDYKEKQNTEVQNNLHLAIINAYNTVAFDRSKKLPKLEKILKKSNVNKPKKKKQNNEELFKIVESLNSMYGGEVI